MTDLNHSNTEKFIWKIKKRGCWRWKNLQESTQAVS